MGGRGLRSSCQLLVFLDHRLVVQGDHVHLAVVLRGQKGCRVRVDLLVDRDHHPHAHELVDEVRALEVHLLGQVGNRDALRDGDLLGHRVGHDDGLLLDLQVLLLRLIVLALRILDLPLGLGEELLGRRLLVVGARRLMKSRRCPGGGAAGPSAGGHTPAGRPDLPVGGGGPAGRGGSGVSRIFSRTDSRTEGRGLGPLFRR